MKLMRRKNLFKKILSVFMGCLLLFMATSYVVSEKVEAASPYGQLKVVGNQLCDSRGQAVQLKGMSSHGLQWYGHYMNRDSINYMKNTWGANVVRAAMYTEEKGYMSNPSYMKSKTKEIVEAAIEAGIYVIIDWHILSDGNPNTHREQAKAFFEEMARSYGHYPNVIYEICNEPNGVSWSGDIKPYAEYIIPAIRAIDPDNIIIVGTSTWSQDVDIAANNPLSFSNIMYACHFYSGTHTQWLRDKIDTALSKGIAVFISEWGTSDASGDGGPFLSEAQVWIDYMNARKLSWCNWSLCDKNEVSAALRGGASTSGGWTDANLSESGKFVSRNMRTEIIPTPIITPTPKPITPTPTPKPEDPKPTPTPNPNQKISVSYQENNWDTGATVSITITNNSSTAINGWVLEWDYPSGQEVTNMWNASYTISGSTVTAGSLSYNENIPANGGTVTFGFNISHSGNNQKPRAFTLNGTICDIK
ncbi:MAG: cellulase family glycosylhydrolase [Clostridiales bacterium]|nr:cellulase family glycosylhydrolase [Clostridiales bacterium]